ncbi:MAG: hypothetical protein ACE5KO_01460 [Candidatus Bathyarchaeia archaeon]
MDKPSVLFIPVASLIHVERVPGPILRGRSLLEEAGLKVFGPKKPIRNISEFPSPRPSEFDTVIIFVASGGTGSLMADIIKDNDWFVWSYHENNSLPSALNAREKLLSKKTWKGKILYNNLSATPSEIVAESYASKALKSMAGLRIGYVGEEDEHKDLFPVASSLSKTFHIEFVPISLEDMKSALNDIPTDLVDQISKEKLKGTEIIEPSREDIQKSVKLYLGLKALVAQRSLNGITLDCYRFVKHTGITPCFAFSFLNDEGILGICEGDVALAPLMSALLNIGGEPTWVGNTSKLDMLSGIVTLAHCSAATRLSEPKGLVRIRSHFESGVSATLDVPLRRGKVTLAHLNLDPPRLVVAGGELIESQLSHWKLSRTQADIKLTCPIQRFFAETGNHQVLSYGDHTDVLAEIGRKLGTRTILL